MGNLLAYATNPFDGLEATISIADVGGHMVDLFSEVWVLVALAIAIPLAFYVFRKFIQLVPGR